jgi:hypothetical protein
MITMTSRRTNKSKGNLNSFSPFYSIPPLGATVGRYHDFHSVAQTIRDRQEGPTKKKQPPSKTQRQMDRFETDSVARKLREVFFEQWAQSKIMCTQQKYRPKK